MTSFDLRTPKGTSIPLNKEVIRIGRAKDNDVIINDPTVSRYHLNIYLKNDQVIIENAGNASGFFLNDQVIHQNASLRIGDQVRFGRAILFLGEVGQVIPKRQASASFNNTQSQYNFSAAKSAGPGMNTKQLIIRGTMLVMIVLLVYKMSTNQEDPAISRQPAAEESKKEAFLINDPQFNAVEENYQHAEPILRGAQDIIAENTFKKGQREYFNKNYVQAIMQFNKALSENPSLEIAKRYLVRAQQRYKVQLEEYLSDANNSYRIGHFNRSKSQATKILTMLSEQIPGYIYRLTNSNRTPDGRPTEIKIQEDLLVEIPCGQTTEPEICKSALDLVRRNRLELHDEEALK